MKVSFDFDSTLDRIDVQEFAHNLIKNGVEVWICTSRFSPENAHRKDWNDDLFAVASKVGIPKDRVIFTNMANKSEVIKDMGFIWHLDDDWIELDFINADTKTKGISVFGQNNWMNKCIKLLNENKL